jgi:transcriptional regulator with XRE-family HTH domain
LEEATMEIGEALRSIRHEKKLTQKEMAYRLGITREHYAQIESGRFHPSLNLLKIITSRLNLHATIEVEGGRYVFLIDEKGNRR